MQLFAMVCHLGRLRLHFGTILAIGGSIFGTELIKLAPQICKGAPLQVWGRFPEREVNQHGIKLAPQI
jgi:hypothetical protein